MFKCDKKQKIYVVCPAGGRTGGLELLHQLVHELNRYDLCAYITYTNINQNSLPNPAYERYIVNYKTFEQIEDKEENLVIISELQIELMRAVRFAEIIVWWLSVDNYQKVYDPLTAYRLLSIKGVLWYLAHFRWKYRVKKINSRIKYNLAQSYYAIDYLKKNNFRNIIFLSDYISKDYLDAEITEVIRKDVVLYNPKKGNKFSRYLMSLDTNILWIPLINLSNIKMRELLITSKVYVDFGNHPGKDRLPREAAYCGCCVITGKMGSAKFAADVSIPESYKFEDKKKFGPEIINKIKECFKEYDICKKDFADYREMIKMEPDKFSLTVKEIFVD